MRSALYVPGNRPELFDKALSGPADVVLLDLEDSVPVRDKDSARAEVAAWLRSIPAGRHRIWVRVNPGERGHEDIRAVAGPPVSALCLAKTESAAQVRAAEAMVRGHEQIRFCPLLESATAVLQAREIAAAQRVERLQLGEADLRADAGIDPGPDDLELLAIRSHLVLVSAAAGIEPPLAPVSTDFRDLGALRTSTEALARLGFRGRACIHPAQIPVVNDVFTPTPAELAAARTLVARFEAARGGVVLDDKGRMVDIAVVRAARRLLAAD
ncbi:HpcH/HpaI aldolase/citrate lyase family protein [Nocardia transvalensis]|uniref:HpcH/HpaI aldolase/citrate lyase family protein n=1 Tax=Nocardia transvalensis TaxID=37333 RepID=UPI00189416BF|nr:CoA ester lyase [Nocardia transvalensis]MBF6331162.1 CoA ester lyase [Nocardia transvalensis]